MNGPEHYRAAEDLLTMVEAEPEASRLTPEYLAAAQVHATLALTAATANAARHPETTPLADVPGPWSNGRQGDGLTWPEVAR